MKRVQPSGPLDARIALIDEAPGEQEELRGEPFVGKSGNLLNQWWDAAGVDRWRVYKDNVVPYRPPNNNIWSVPKEELYGRWVPELFERLSRLTDVRVIVPTGNLACSVLLGSVLGKVPGILSLRGSTYDISGILPQTKTGGSSPTWCIPTIHPAWFLRGQMKKQGRAIGDWRRIHRVAAEGHRNATREILTNPSSNELSYFRSNVDGCISVDIETLGRDITCVGFAASPYLAIVFPTLSSRQKERYLPVVKDLCESSYEKVLQNGHYDEYWLRHFGISLNNWEWDTMWMHHALDPADEHSLQYLASRYVYDYQAWKEEREDDKAGGGKRLRDPNALWQYNGHDVLYTREVYDALRCELESAGLLGFYQRHYSRLFDSLGDTNRHGVRIDAEAQRRVRDELREENSGIRESLREIAGYELYAVESKTSWRSPTPEEEKELWHESPKSGKRVYHKELAVSKGYAGASKKGLVGVKSEVLKKDFSGVKLRRFFYEDLALPKQTHWAAGVGGKHKVVSVDETALKKLAGRYPGKAGEAVRLILKHRENKGEADDFNEKWDEDGRIRCQYSFNTEAGRFSSKANPMRSGRNLQNVKRGPQRKTYLPDKGCVFLAIDGSQVEDRVVKMLTGSRRLVELANTRPQEFDAHTYNAARVFGVSESEVTKAQRDLGKMAVHAAQRGMRGNRLADRLLTEAGLVMSVQRCQRFIDKYLEDHWEIAELYFPGVRKELFEKRELVNTWGRRWKCKYDEMEDDLYRRAYSFGPQSECNDWMVQMGYVYITEWIKKRGFKSRVNLLMHDEVILSCPPDEAYSVATALVGSLEKPRTFPSGELVIPADVALGATWDKDVEWNCLPGEEEFNEGVRRVMG